MTPQTARPLLISPPLLPDELLSSWLIRTALAHGCDPLVLTGQLWPGWRLWTLDPDRDASVLRLDVLAGATVVGWNYARQETPRGRDSHARSVQTRSVSPIAIAGVRWRYC